MYKTNLFWNLDYKQRTGIIFFVHRCLNKMKCSVYIMYRLEQLACLMSPIDYITNYVVILTVG